MRRAVLWRHVPLGDLRSGAGYSLNLTPAGDAIMDGDSGLRARVALCERLVQAKAMLERPCVVRLAGASVGVPPEVLLERARRLANPPAGFFGHRK